MQSKLPDIMSWVTILAFFLSGIVCVWVGVIIHGEAGGLIAFIVWIYFIVGVFFVLFRFE
jgi:hypothetical protein